MASISEEAFKLKYQKYKLKVKLWESEFTKTNGRLPSKDDIKAASPDIKDSYRKYWKLKTLNLQRTILDPILHLEDDNSVLAFEDVKTGGLKQENVHLLGLERNESDTKSVSPSLERLGFKSLDEPLITSSVSLQSGVCGKSMGDLDSSTNESDVWGLHLNKMKKSSAPEIVDIKPNSSGLFSKKLFNGSKFNLKRNPRKSRLFTERSKSDVGIRHENSSSQSSNSFTASEEALVDKPILDSGLSSHDDTMDLILKLSSDTNSLKVKYSEEPVSRKSVSIFSGNVLESNSFKLRKLNDGWVARNSFAGVTDDNNLSNHLDSFSSPAGEDSQKENSIVCMAKSVSVDDDLVSDSDTESSQKTSVFQSRMKRKKSIVNVSDSGACGEVRPDKIQKLDVKPCVSNAMDSEESSNKVVVSLPKVMLKKLSKATEDSFSSAKRKRKTHVCGDEEKKTENLKLKALERKMSSGTANENFVKINIKKKVYVRGKKNTSFSKYKKMMYKKKSKDGDELCGKRLVKCFKCGDVGHYSRNCLKVDQLIPVDENEDDVSTFPTLEEAAAMSQRIMAEKYPHRTIGSGQNQNEKEDQIEENDEEVFSIGVEDPCEMNVVKPIYELLDGETLIDTPQEVFDVLKMFGHESFRPGQEEAVMRILSGRSTLLMLSTGAGKSLCYQLPSYLFAQKSNCITLVVSPLVSLMEDQVYGLPSFLKAVCLHTNQTEKQREKIFQLIKKGGIHFILVSPEAVVGCGGGGGSATSFSKLLAHLPPIAFACIDEAHCVSQWSHNFRPSYLMVCKILREKLNVKTVLGLTATATKTTATSIAVHLEIPDGEKGIIKGIPLPNNLLLSVSQDDSKDEALIALMNGKRFKDCESLIIYCTRREECVRLATLIRTYFQDSSRPESNTRRNRISWNAEPYHAGLSAARRKKVQQSFMSGDLRIVVATVAFGMGINKQNIRGIIHYNMPSNIESYVQEVGRAGRDGLTAHCHVFMDKKGGDLNELRRHIHGNSVDRHTIRKLLQKVFVPCGCGKEVKGSKEILEGNEDQGGVIVESNETERVVCPRHEVAIPVDETVNALDLPDENIATLLCYLELHPKKWIKVLNRVYSKCKVQCYSGARQLKEAAYKCPALAMAIAMDLEKGITHEKSSGLEFSVVEVASKMGWNSGLVKKHLKDLEWRKDVGGKWHRTGILVEFSVLGYHLESPGNLLPAELDEALDMLHGRVMAQEEASLKQLNSIHSALNANSHKSCLECADQVDEKRSDELKKYINEYFKEEVTMELAPPGPLANDGLVRDDIRHLVFSYRDQNFTGRSVARILHGISSPCFPPYVWGRTRFWRLHLSSDFRTLCRVATDEILKLR